MKRKIFLYIAMGALVVCTACNKAQETATAPQTTTEQQDRPQGENRGNMTIAKVTFVTDHSINVVTANMPQRDDSQKPSGENTEKPTGERPTDNGDAPKNRGDFKIDTSKLEFSSDETLIEIPDESIIFKIQDNTEIGCSLSDIKEGDILQIRYNSDGVTPEKITINNASEKAE